MLQNASVYRPQSPDTCNQQGIEKCWLTAEARASCNVLMSHTPVIYLHCSYEQMRSADVLADCYGDVFCTLLFLTFFLASPFRELLTALQYAPHVACPHAHH